MFTSDLLCSESAHLVQVQSLNEVACCPGFVFEEVASRSLHPDSPGYAKPHICCFAEEYVGHIRSSDISSRIEFGYSELFFDIKAQPQDDFFIDPPPISDVDANAAHHFLRFHDPADKKIPTEVQQADRALGQHIAYVTEMFARQFRVFLFSLSMSGSRLRLLRWDRSGCIVSESFDIRQQPELLCEFLWRFSHASAIDRGYDVTTEIALPEEEKLFRSLVTTETRIQLGVEGEELDQAVSQHYEPGRVMAVYVLDQGAPDDDAHIRRFLISRPIVSPLQLVGRGTRGYWAVDIETRRVLFVKDTWRSRSPSGLEGHTLQRLNDVNVRNVPFLIAHGDVPHRLTRDGRRLTRELL